jgi:hypothetical protein
MHGFHMTAEQDVNSMKSLHVRTRKHHELQKSTVVAAQSDSLLESLLCLLRFGCFSFFAFFSFLCLLFFSFLYFFLSLDCRQFGGLGSGSQQCVGAAVARQQCIWLPAIQPQPG